MKTTLITAIIFLVSTQVYADCGGIRTKFWPKGKTIQQNSILMIEGDINEYILNELDDKHPIYLESWNHKVKLIVQETRIGEYYTSQVILYPEEKLIIGQTYQLVSDSLTMYETLLKGWNPKILKYESLEWTVEAGIDKTPPIFQSMPKESNKVLDYYSSSCGEEIHVIFNTTVEDQSECLVKTRVTDKKNNTITTFYLVIKNRKIRVGHGICSGAFYLKSGGEYEVEFSLIDASGNISENITSKIEFNIPKKKIE